MDKYTFEKKFNATIADKEDFILCMANTKTGSVPPRHKFDSHSGDIKKKLANAIYFVKFFPEKDVFIVWNNRRRRESGGGHYTFELKKGWDYIETGPDVFNPYYKELRRNSSNIWEKIYVVGVYNFDRFFQNCDAYMKFNELDDKFPHRRITELEMDIHWRTESERRKYSSSQYHRDRQFRDEVLAAYDYKCAICRCDIAEVLQAAHERGYEVAHTSYDDPRHGICLCANHHLMYDKGLININIKQCTVEIVGNEAGHKDWYEEFKSKYGGKIVERT